MAKIQEIRNELAYYLERLAFTIKNDDSEYPSDLDIRVTEFIAAGCEEEQKNALLYIVNELKKNKNKKKDKPRHLSIVKK